VQCKKQQTLTSQVATKYLMDERRFLAALVNAERHQHHCLYMYRITYIHIHTFYDFVDFVWDYPGELCYGGGSESIWILLKQKTVSGSSISWDVCKTAPRPRQITTPAPHHSDFYRPDALPATQPTASKH